ncbi:MAG: hypothetical protein ACOYLQ_07985 [Hyphomicrobiaceae bacterium]|jgi:hypothetical protein
MSEETDDDDDEAAQLTAELCRLAEGMPPGKEQVRLVSLALILSIFRDDSDAEQPTWKGLS